MTTQALGWVLDNCEAKGAQRLVMISIANHHGESGAWPSHTTVAHETRLTAAHVKRVLSDLVDAGLLIRVVNGAPDERIRKDKRPNLYWIVGLASGGITEPPGSNERGVERRTSGGWNDARAGGLGEPPKLKTEPTTEPEGAAAEPTPPPTRKASTCPDPFFLTAEMRTWAVTTVPYVDLTFETKQFVNHHRAKGSTFKKWELAWKNWMLKSEKWNQERSRPRWEPPPADDEEFEDGGGIRSQDWPADAPWPPGPLVAQPAAPMYQS